MSRLNYISKELIKLLTFLSIINPIAFAESSGDIGLIRRICLSSFNLEMKKAEKTAPPGMGDFTCECFLALGNIGSSISFARATCQAKATEKFNL